MVVEENWLHFDNQEYRLLAWVVMPNHVHLLVEIWQTPQAQLVKDWKGFTARRINRLLGRSGKLWQDDYWDRYIRDEAHYRKVVHYIEANPVKAGLVKTPEQWPFSSARFRDEYRRLNCPRNQASHDRSADRRVRVFQNFGRRLADKAVRAPARHAPLRLALR